MIADDTSIDGRPIIRCAWPDSAPMLAPPLAVHTLDETAAYMRAHGMPGATRQTILDIERTALRKLRHHPVIMALHEEYA